MSKRPPPRPSDLQPTAKRVHMAEEYNSANAVIHSQVQLFSQVFSSEELLVQSLLQTFLFAPPEACMRAAPTVTQCEELIENNPDLKQALQEAIQRGRYDAVMLLPILQKDIQQDITQPQTEGIDYRDNKDLNATFNAFKIPYISHFPQALLKSVDGGFATAQRYNNSSSIIQSSGTGKSRGVAEAAKIRFSFLFNLRGNNKYFAYPPPDDIIRDYLKPTNREARARYAAFLCSLFTCAPKRISSVERKGTPLAKWWYEYLNGDETEDRPGSERMRFYKVVVEESKKIEQEYYGKEEKELLSFLETSCSEFVAFLQNQHQLDNPPSIPKVVCILAFDEAQELASSPANEKRSNYHHLGSILKEIVQHPVFTVFLSTNSNIRMLAPPAHVHPSLCEVLDPPELSSPVTELPFDVFAKDLNDKLSSRGKSTLSTVSSLGVMVRFGRTLWYPLDKNGYTSVILLAMAKLNPTQIFCDDALAHFACLAIRIGLDFDASREIGRMQQIQLVESYMRVVFAVPDNREYMRTGTPSEPILAAAAARLLNGIPRTPLEELAPKVLNEAYQKGFLARGEGGKVVARLLWTLAHDKVIRNRQSSSDAPEIFHKPILVLDFLRNLFHEDYWEVICNARPMGDANGPTLAKAFETAYICFSHFMDAVDYDVDFEKVYWLLLRGAALSCQRDQRSIDFLTPILFGSPDSTPITRSNTSVLQAQVKNRNKREKIFVDPSLVESIHPVISIVHELGHTKNAVECTPPFPGGNALHTRHYQIVSRGCSSDTFGVIPSSMDQVYPMLLRSNLLMEDFPRLHIEECVSLFRQMDPCTGIDLGEEGKLGLQRQGAPSGETWSWFGKHVE